MVISWARQAKARQWPAELVMPALLAVAADPTSRSPMRLTQAGLWWDRQTATEAPRGAGCRQSAPELHPLRDALAELVDARGQVRRFAFNVNQAVRELNSTGTPPEWLATAVTITGRAVTRLDPAATDLR